MSKFSVTFLPEGKTVAVEEGATLLDAAQQAGVYVNSICGGEGACGKCRVVVKNGRVHEQPHTHFSPEEVQRGYALACQTVPTSDVVVEVPLESRAEGGRIVVGGETDAGRGPDDLASQETKFPYNPVTRKLYLELPPPSLDDNLPDLDRIYREIRRVTDAPIVQTGLKYIWQIPEILRESAWKVTATLGERGGTTEVIQIEPGDTSSRNLGVAIDVGTTTLAVHLVDLTTGKTIATEAAYNPQIQYGEDVITRLIFAGKENGQRILHDAIVETLNSLIDSLVQQSGSDLNDITAVACAGNTTMEHFLIDLNPNYIRLEPYVPAACQVPPVRAAEVGIDVNPRGLLYCMPCVSSYVGGDISAGVLASGICFAEKPSMLIDVGTNGEIVVGNKEWLVCCSASAGPAFEGGSVKYGMRAGRGAIERVEIADGGGSVKLVTVGDDKPLGICGSGLIDAIAELLGAGVIDQGGNFVKGTGGNRLRGTDSGLEFVLAWKDESAVADDICLTQPDIDNLVRSKAAVYAGTAVLLGSLEMSYDQLDRIFIAGGFGHYLDIERAIAIGLLPPVDPKRVRFIGNSSVNGARMTMLSVEAMNTVLDTARRMTYIELSTDNRFMDEFVKASFLPHTDVEMFSNALKRNR